MMHQTEATQHVHQPHNGNIHCQNDFAFLYMREQRKNTTLHFGCKGHEECEQQDSLSTCSLVSDTAVNATFLMTDIDEPKAVSSLPVCISVCFTTLALFVRNHLQKACTSSFVHRLVGLAPV